ncbi:MAG: cobalamine-related hypothetical metal-binding protein CrdX [Thermoplasmata archaeon]|nr:MAG: cobalamine-related hypothetical metal-binding protein CrdX [Thermoplasmata archaeon]
MEPKAKVQTENYKGFTNKKCEFYPCHEVKGELLNCLFCYCTLAWLECPGNYIVIETKGIKRKDCSNCKLPHIGYKVSWDLMQHWLEKPETWGGY